MQFFDRLYHTSLKPWFVISFIGFIIVSFFYFDEPVAYYFNGLQLKSRLIILFWITKIGRAELFLIILLFLPLFYRYYIHNKTMEIKCWFLFLCVLIPYVVCLILKIIIGRARPELLFSEHLYGLYGLHMPIDLCSFPSGHTSAICGLMFGLIILYPRFRYIFLVVGLSLSSLRILLLHHYLSDVLGTIYLVTIEIGLFLQYLRKKPNRFGLNWISHE